MSRALSVIRYSLIKNFACIDSVIPGSTGSWNAATGPSNGWTEWDVDLSAYAGKQVEISISYMSDWGTQGLGVFLDNVRVEAGTTTEATSFEDGLGGWTVGGPPAGSGPNSNNWSRSQLAFDSGGVTTTADTVYAGFGLERLTPAARDDFVRRAMQHLGM